jgi:hypothetical protein
MAQVTGAAWKGVISDTEVAAGALSFGPLVAASITINPRGVDVLMACKDAGDLSEGDMQKYSKTPLALVKKGGWNQYHLELGSAKATRQAGRPLSLSESALLETADEGAKKMKKTKEDRRREDGDREEAQGHAGEEDRRREGGDCAEAQGLSEPADS